MSFCSFAPAIDVPPFEILERAKGIEPSYAAWEAAVLPLNYAREPQVGYFCSFLPRLSSRHRMAERQRPAAKDTAAVSTQRIFIPDSDVSAPRPRRKP